MNDGAEDWIQQMERWDPQRRGRACDVGREKLDSKSTTVDVANNNYLINIYIYI